MAESDGKAESKATSGAQRDLASEIDRAIEINMTCSPELVAEVSEMKAEVERLCAAGDTEKAKRLTAIAVTMLRTGEPAKE